MTAVGIEAMNLYAGIAYLDVLQLAEYRQLDTTRFANLLMKEKTVALPYEDPVSYAINAAKPIVDTLSAAEKDRIELLVVCSESGIDFGKSMSSYVHHYLELNRNCRQFELKQACYAGTAGFQTAVNFILSQVSPGAKALVISSDIARFIVSEQGTASDEPWFYAEPSSGAGAVALLVSENPAVFQVDVGANGYYGYEVMDTCRPGPDTESGDADLSLMSYLDCCEQAFLEYQKRVSNADYRESFHALAFHTPFGGMVQGAHRMMMRKLVKATPAEIEADFQQRVLPGLTYCRRVGNIMAGTVFLSLAGIIDQGRFDEAQRIGCFSYGSGCCSEFYSGVATHQSRLLLRRFELEKQLDSRFRLSMADYEAILRANRSIRFGTRNLIADYDLLPEIAATRQEKPVIVLKEIKDYHRHYQWLS